MNSDVRNVLDNRKILSPFADIIDRCVGVLCVVLQCENRGGMLQHCRKFLLIRISW
jgi:hypothetical protein